MQIRSFIASDAAQIAQLFHDTVRQVNSRDYTPSQVIAWAPDDLNFRDWATVCATYFTYVAEANGTIAGFAELDANELDATGRIDCFYVHKDFQRQGVGRRLYEAIEAKALTLSLTRLNTEASITAKPFFQSMGFTVLREQTVTRRGEQFRNYPMQKSLIAGD